MPYPHVQKMAQNPKGDMCDGNGTSHRKHASMHDLKNVRHTRVGVWDLYEDLDVSNKGLFGMPGFDTIRNEMPYVWRMLKEIVGLGNCRTLLILYFGAYAGLAVLPAITLWKVLETSLYERH